MWTGKKSLYLTEVGHDFWYVWKKNYWLPVLFLILFLILIPFSTAGLPGDSMFNLEYTHDQVKYRFFHESVRIPVMAGAVAMGVVCGLTLFRFLLNKRDTTMFLSLALTRRRMYINRAAAGCLTCAVSLAVPMLVSLKLNRMAVGAYPCQVRDCLYLIWGLCVLSLTGFFITAAACMISGTAAEAVIYTAGILAAPGMLFFSVNLLAKQFYWGNSMGVTGWLGTGLIRESLAGQLEWLNPVLFFRKELEVHSVFIRPNEDPVPPDLLPGVLAGWTVVMILLAVLACILLKRRKAENAGISGANPVLSEIMIALTALLVFSLAVTFLGEFSVVLGLVFAYGLFAAVHLFWRKSFFVCRFRKRRVLISGGDAALDCTLVCLAFVFFLPQRCGRLLEEPENFTEAEVSFVGSPDYLYEAAAGTSSRGYYVVSSRKLTDPEDIALAAEIQKAFLDSGKQEMELQEDPFSETVVPYDIRFSYTCADGKEYSWYYDRASMTQLKAMLSLEDSPEVRENQRRVFTDELSDPERVVWANEAYRTGEVYLTDSLYQNTWELSLDEAGRRELLEALAEDVGNQSLDDRYFPEKTAAGVLMFTRNAEYDLTYYSYHLDNAFIYLTDEFTNTIAFLEKYGLMEYVSTKPEIETILLQEFDPYASVNGLQAPFSMYFKAYRADSENEFLIQKDFGSPIVVTNQERIEALRQAMHNNYFMGDGGYLAAVKLKNSENWVYEFIPYPQAPAFLLR